MKPLSEKHASISESETLAINAKANALKAQGVKIINFSSGEPDFKTPTFIRDAAIRFIDKGHIRYTPSAGILPLKEAICAKLKRDNTLDYKPDEIVVSSGAKHALYNIFQVLLNPGDEVIVPKPYWTSYPAMIQLAGGQPVFVDTTDNGFDLEPEKVAAMITDKTKAILINSPNNPTGVVYSKEVLEGMKQLALKHQLYVISDEIYEKLIYEGTHISIAALGQDIKKLTITVNGLSKSHAMTGWRLGYVAAEKPIVKAITNLQSHSTSNASTITQYAALEALSGDDTEVEMMRQSFLTRREMILERIKTIPHIKANHPQGAFYVMLDVQGLFGRKHGHYVIRDVMDVANLFLEQAHVAMIPGRAFGCDNALRMSYSTSQSDITEGLNRMEELIKAIV